MAVIMGLGLLFYILLGFRYSLTTLNRAGTGALGSGFGYLTPGAGVPVAFNGSPLQASA